jgi:hypothetical protein
MSADKGLFESILDQHPGVSIEDACKLFQQALRDQPEALGDVEREVLGHILSDPARAREIITSHPHLAALSSLVDLIETRLRARVDKHSLH